MMACGGSVGETVLQAGKPLDGRADRHEFEQPAQLVDVRFDADHVVGPDRGRLVADEADRVLAGVINQRRQLVDLSPRK